MFLPLASILLGFPLPSAAPRRQPGRDSMWVLCAPPLWARRGHAASAALPLVPHGVGMAMRSGDGWVLPLLPQCRCCSHFLAPRLDFRTQFFPPHGLGFRATMPRTSPVPSMHVCAGNSIIHLHAGLFFNFIWDVLFAFLVYCTPNCMRRMALPLGFFCTVTVCCEF